MIPITKLSLIYLMFFFMITMPNISIADEIRPVAHKTNTKSPIASNKPNLQYTLSPGDILFISLPGEDSFNKRFQIDRDGHLLLPEIGDIQVAGLTLKSIKIRLVKSLSNVFRDLSRFEIIIKEKRLLISVLGYVKQPGFVDLPSRSGIQMAINKAGGLVPGAQLDKIQLRRGDKVFTFNYKDYLDSGDIGLLPKINSLDVLFVPSSPLIGNVQADFDASTVISGGDASEDDNAIKIFGEVKNPGIFSYKKKSTVLNMLLRAGGATRFGNVEHIRVISNNKTTLFNLKSYLDDTLGTPQPKLIPGSTIYVPKETKELKSGGRTVYIMGQVPKPGAYESVPNATLLDILGNAGGPTRFADPSKIKIIRVTGDIENFDLNEFLKGSETQISLPIINSGDAIYIPELPKDPANKKSLWVHLPSKDSIYILGEVNSPGRYRFDKKFNFLDILSAADGPSTNADLHNIRITHRSGNKAIVSKLNLSIYFQTGDETILPIIMPEDTIYIPSKTSHWLDEHRDDTVRIIGAIGKPGRYRFGNDMTILDLLAEAGGTNNDAYIEKIVVITKSCCGDKSTTFDLNKFTKTANFSDLPPLKAGDTVYVPNVSESYWKIFMSGLKDIVSILTFIVLLGVL